ncbi:hypothetical protein [Streptomyces parvulus]|uniref:hypothetical protein n=1 Tax=Streptomyces parvulus TaxID=146923 RepID=UPI00340FD017
MKADSKLGIVGTNLSAGGFYRLSVAAGYRPVFHAYDRPELPCGAVDKKSTCARPEIFDEMMSFIDIAVLPVPLAHYDDPSAEGITKKIIGDQRGRCPETRKFCAFMDLDDAESVSGSWRSMGGWKLVKVLHLVGWHHLARDARPKGDEQRLVLHIVGSSVEAKERVACVVDALGYDAVDAGTFAHSICAADHVMAGDACFPNPRESALRENRLQCRMGANSAIGRKSGGSSGFPRVSLTMFLVRV